VSEDPKKTALGMAVEHARQAEELLAKKHTSARENQNAQVHALLAIYWQHEADRQA